MMIVFDCLMSIYQCVLIVYVLKKQIHQKSHSLLWEIGCIILMVLTLTFIQTFGINIPDVLVFLILLVYITIVADERFIICVFWVAIDVFLFMSTLALVSSIFDIQIASNGDVIAASKETMIIYAFAGNSAVTVVLSIAARISHAKNLITQKEVALFLFMLVLGFLISECFFSARIMSDNQVYLLIGSASSFVVMILTIVLYEHMQESAKRQKQAELSAQTAQLSAEHQDELRNIYQKMLSEQHDLRHRIAAAEELLTTANLQEEKHIHIMSLLQENNGTRMFFTGSMAADAVLLAKATIMENAGIAFHFSECPLLPLPISERDFCVLLSNLLDNAIEGVMNLPAGAPSRAIWLSFSKVWDMLFLSCENDANPSKIKKKGEYFLSTKAFPELHGFGIENMRQIVKSADGTIEFWMKDDRFLVEIMLGRGKNAC